MSELFTIYSPAGEKFEVTRPNFNDLTKHAGWSQSPIIPAVAVPPVENETPQEPAAAADESEAEQAEDETVADEETTEDEAPKARLTVEDFADLADKADVAAYIAATFPDFKIDGRANRDKLVAQAIELATPAE